jgi:Tol biopolymer transport system component
MSSEFVSKFDPMNEEHVLWLQKIDNVMAQLAPDKQMNIAKDINENPFGIKGENVLDWAYVHFQLALKYSQGVLRGKAFIPKTFP